MWQDACPERGNKRNRDGIPLKKPLNSSANFTKKPLEKSICLYHVTEVYDDSKIIFGESVQRNVPRRGSHDEGGKFFRERKTANDDSRTVAPRVGVHVAAVRPGRPRVLPHREQLKFKICSTKSARKVGGETSRASL